MDQVKKYNWKTECRRINIWIQKHLKKFENKEYSQRWMEQPFAARGKERRKERRKERGKEGLKINLEIIIILILRIYSYQNLI